jgi:hypothetical protein
MSDDRDDFLGRWSRRKRAIKERSEPAAPEERATAAAPPTAGDAATDETGGGDTRDTGPATPTDLPDPETLDETADFSVFLREGVPEALRRQALRRLWRLNPVFANLDGLNDYDEDYTNAATVLEGLKTAYRAGRGFVNDAAESDAAAPASETPRASADDSAPAVDADSGRSDALAPPAEPHAPVAPVTERADEPGDATGETPPRAAAGSSRDSTRPASAPRRRARLRRWGDTS